MALATASIRNHDASSLFPDACACRGICLAGLCLLATMGVELYRELESELIHRDEAALVFRVNQLRNLLNDSNTRDLIRTKPALFQNMMGNRESVLSIGCSRGASVTRGQPGNLDIPQLVPVAMEQTLELSDCP